jgi:hypothetical protein
MFKIFYNFNAKQSEIIVSAAWTLRELRIFIAKELKVANDIRLVKAGKVLDMDDSTLESLEIKENDVIFVARTSLNNAAAQASQTSSSSHRNVLDLADNPFLQSMLNSPEIMSSILESDPRFSEMAEKNPELRSVMRDPAFIKQTLDCLRNPVARKELMRNQDRQLSNIEALPGGFNYLSSMFSDLKDPLSDSPDPSTEEANRRLSQALGVDTSSREKKGPNLSPLPNPWNRDTRNAGSQDMFYGVPGLNSSMHLSNQSFPSFNSGFANFGSGTSNMNMASSSNGFQSEYNTGFQTLPSSQLSREAMSNFEVKYSSQLSTMDGMGFTVFKTLLNIGKREKYTSIVGCRRKCRSCYYLSP